MLSLAWPLAVIGIGQGLFAGPNSVAVLSATGREHAATAGGLASVLRTFGFSLGPAAGALCHAAAPAVTAGFTAGVVVLVAAATAALIVSVLGRRGR